MTEDTLKQWLDQLCSLVRRRRTYNEVRNLLVKHRGTSTGAYYLDHQLEVYLEEIEIDIQALIAEVVARTK